MTYLDEISLRGQDANPFFRMMDIQVESFREGTAELSMEVRPDMLNGDGWLQGGIFTAICDEAMALALCTVLDENESIATVSESTSFMRGVQNGTLRAIGRVIKKGRRIAFTEGEVIGEKDARSVLSRTSASFAIIKQ
ncbi:MAG: PaaI family thioesterase [Methanogenium sp.]|nr:PaaI family thioesterase [Methanogenium sp.]